MSLEERLTNTFNDILRSSGYIYEIINNNTRQSNLITGPNNQLIPSPVTNQLARSIAQFDQILDETISKFNDARWCVEQIVDTRQKQEELKAQEELERQKRAELERKKKEEEEAARKKLEENRLLEEKRAKELELELDAKEKEKEKEKEQQAKEKERKSRSEGASGTVSSNNVGKGNAATGPMKELSLMDNAFDLDLDLDKDQDLLNPSDILSTINYKNDNMANKPDTGLDNMDLDFDAVLNGGPSVLEDLNMDLLDQDFDAGQGLEEEFDVDTFLNQIGNGD